MEPDLRLLRPSQSGPPSTRARDHGVGLCALRRQRFFRRKHSGVVAFGRAADLAHPRTARGGRFDAQRTPLAAQHRLPLLRLGHAVRVRDRRRTGEARRRRGKRQQRRKLVVAAQRAKIQERPRDDERVRHARIPTRKYAPRRFRRPHYASFATLQSGMSGQRSHSAAPCDSPSAHMSRSRSKSPRRSATDHRSLSPPIAVADYPPTTYVVPRFQSRSATATPTGSPKKRQLPQVPQALARALQERVAQDLDQDRKHRMRYVHTYRSTGAGWERRYSGLIDSDLANHARVSRRGQSPERDRDPLGLGDFDSDMESVASVTSSAFSTQSERPRGTKTIR